MISADRLLDYIGYRCPATEWLTVTERQVAEFAESLELPLQQVSTAYLALSLIPRFSLSFSIQVEPLRFGMNYGLDEVAFGRPLKAGDRVRACAEIADIQQTQPDHFLLRYRVHIEADGEPQALVMADWLALIVVG